MEATMPDISNETLDEVERVIAEIAMRLTGARQIGRLNGEWFDVQEDAVKARDNLRAEREVK